MPKVREAMVNAAISAAAQEAHKLTGGQLMYPSAIKAELAEAFAESEKES